MRQLFLVMIVGAIAACGGSYAQNTRAAEGADRGETNGRSFEFVSNKPEGDDWSIRIRDTSMSVGYGNEDTSEDLGTISLDKKETAKVWKLIDALEMSERKKGKKDEDEGYVMLRMREPGGDEGHDMITVFVSRATADEEVLNLAEYLRSIIGKYRKEKPNF
ncbi:MAG: hypothetical protein H0V17_32040 [Deltaproteobacteria bacterium]|nr:hypothetical protein [Deltaproteobacteria bacterium]